MRKSTSIPIQLDEQGHLILPEEVLSQYGLVPGSSSRLETSEQGFFISRSSSCPSIIYVEPTNACNLDCSTCMRNVWEEPLGWMSWQTYEQVLKGIRSIQPTPTVFFGGLGEPLAHPKIREMVAAARNAGAEVELITNGTLLDEKVAQWMVAYELNRVWVSIDGATPGSYMDVRLGDALPQVIHNITILKQISSHSSLFLPKLGIAFVAMKRNVNDLPEVIRLGKRLGADQFSITNVLPYNAALRREVLYSTSLSMDSVTPSRWSPLVSIPRMNHEVMFFKLLPEAMKSYITLQLSRQSLKMGVDSCPFIEKNSISIRWDGEVSPCLPLLHTHSSYLDDKVRTSHAYSVGNIQEHSLLELWNDPAYIGLRSRLQDFDFSPCTYCNSCEMAEANLEDCFGNEHPTCGGCLWAQGFIQCP